MESLAAHFNIHSGGKRIHNGNTYTMEAAGYSVAAAAKFASCMQFGHNRFHTGPAFSRDFINRDSAAVIYYLHTVIRQNRHFNMRSIPCKRFIN